MEIKQLIPNHAEKELVVFISIASVLTATGISSKDENMVSCKAPPVPENTVGVLTIRATPALLDPPANFYLHIEKDGARVCTFACFGGYARNCTTDFLNDDYVCRGPVNGGIVDIMFASAQSRHVGQYDVQLVNGVSYKTSCNFTLRAGVDNGGEMGCSVSGWIVAVVFLAITVICLAGAIVHIKRDKIVLWLPNAFGK